MLSTRRAIGKDEDHRTFATDFLPQDELWKPSEKQEPPEDRQNDDENNLKPEDKKLFSEWNGSNQKKKKEKKEKKEQKKRKKKVPQPEKYNQYITTNANVDVWIKMTSYINWISKVVFYGKDYLICHLPSDYRSAQEAHGAMVESCEPSAP